ncbi:hypothetical protein Hamer_G012808 [Homarus americanus]|uniref:Uncharacterized protein n=1 Tax=Homarus americanus TaxID=6706 RepID=A0A8J5MXD2_HOMAM|nr:hypothetical protein Hamer_G012808 [Homarus americanus]
MATSDSLFLFCSSTPLVTGGGRRRCCGSLPVSALNTLTQEPSNYVAQVPLVCCSDELSCDVMIESDESFNSFTLCSGPAGVSCVFPVIVRISFCTSFSVVFVSYSLKTPGVLVVQEVGRTHNIPEGPVGVRRLYILVVGAGWSSRHAVSLCGTPCLSTSTASPTPALTTTSVTPAGHARYEVTPFVFINRS